MTRATGKSFLLITAILGCLLSGCLPLEPKIYQWYISPRINSYVIDSIDLLPLERDDTTNTGTFYSTNYFYQSLKNNYPAYKFEVLDISKALQNDSLIVDKLIYPAENDTMIDLQKLYSSEIGDSLNKIKPDAIILGRINYPNVNLQPGQEPGRILKSVFQRQIGCNFTYYMASLKDGKILWMSNVLGVADYNEGIDYDLEMQLDFYPPLDQAISNGIDKIINLMPLKRY